MMTIGELTDASRRGQPISDTMAHVKTLLYSVVKQHIERLRHKIDETQRKMICEQVALEIKGYED